MPDQQTEQQTRPEHGGRRKREDWDLSGVESAGVSGGGIDHYNFESAPKKARGKRPTLYGVGFDHDSDIIAGYVMREHVPSSEFCRIAKVRAGVILDEARVQQLYYRMMPSGVGGYQFWRMGKVKGQYWGPCTFYLLTLEEYEAAVNAAPRKELPHD